MILKLKSLRLVLTSNLKMKKKLIPFLRNSTVNSEVVMLADQDANSWIPMVYDEWDGAIPASILIYNNWKSRKFTIGEFEEKDF